MKPNRHLVLALLTFLLVITVLPAAAEFNSKFKIPYAKGYAVENSKSTKSYEIQATNSPVTLLEQGKQFYDVGRFAEAAQLWEKAALAFEQRGERQNQAISYNYLAIVYQDLGQWKAAQKASTQALNLLPSTDAPLLYAQVLNTQGSIELNTGHAETALETWKQAEKHYRSLKDVTGIVLSQINQAQALQTLGLYRRARSILEQVNQDLAGLPDSLLKARQLRSLGVTLQVVGDLQNSQTVLTESLTIAKRLNSTPDIGETLFRLGNTARAIGDFEAALAFYQQATNTSKDPRTQLEAQLNQLSLLVTTKQQQPALSLLPQIQARLSNLPPSRAVIYAQVNFVESLTKLSIVFDKKQNTKDISQILVRAVQQARELKDSRGESYALGQLGHLYEQTQQWSEALSLTQQALVLAQKIQATDIAATWYWQQGRILNAQGNTTAAIAAYNEAASILQSLRQDLVAVNSAVQFSFRDEVEPVYRQLVQLLLQNVDSLSETTRQQRLQRSREVIEALQLAELENFFREACLTYKPRAIEKIDPTAAVIYPIVLDQRLEVVLSLPGQPLQHHGIEVSPQETARVFTELRQSLNPVFLPNEVLPPAQQMYNWLLRPISAQLERHSIKTLVFVLDDFLRSLPMAVLHDGQQYLVERYNIALAPGLQLLDSRVSAQELKTLAGGLSEARQGFSALPGVETEIQQIAARVSTKVLLNEKFTRSNFLQRVENQPFSVVHLATHGQFSSKAEDTFLLSWDDRIHVKDLDRLLRGEGKNGSLRDQEPIELLILSACQTAKGDNRAALGLAGVAVRSGARSTLATLWSVQDLSTAQLMAEFYRRFTQPGVTKAEALRYSQLSLLNSPQYKHPYYWAPFVLVGNWQ
ncbi:CHAT domain-containing protein [Tolypothrix campylonemoides VB511288]|nr:CHAT domain-containing protein [Tolypothrix campylonemoides VB511288]